ncbi:8-amino-7-oxononanoate synthase [Flavobacterium sp. 3HN19-14]|uniref:8-amino-7-oxononanoate synthase n=1 Tax=Flavobacterium sp. 3HN19-14 TaxID=3448133 RepID=UPI003EE07DF9
MKTTISHKIFETAAALPENWNALSDGNIFLTRDYLEVLEKSAPVNMTCHFIGLFEEEQLVGIALSQFLDLNKLESFGERDRCIRTSVRNFIFKTFASHVLFIGNNMLTGQNAFSFDEKINKTEALSALKAASESVKKLFKKRKLTVHITTFKDFLPEETAGFKKAGYADYYKFTIQPNMVFTIDPNWKSEQDYINALSKKYRDQYKRARKKSEGIEKRKMHLEDIIAFEETIYKLYMHVARNAPFNTFLLAKNHFSTFKRLLKDQFLFYGYFVEEKLIGFNTLIKNGNTMDTYFLGYDDSVQKEKMLYLNMLYDMIAYSVNKGFCQVIFARTALEIKSSVGAQPIEMYGLIQHRNKQINKRIAKIFDYLEPKTEWKERNPFK